jgi:diphthine synthase
MGTLYFIGLGINPPYTISLEALKSIKNCKKIFLEDYTNFFSNEQKKAIEKLVKKKIIFLNRDELENEKIILDELKYSDCALLVSGEALIATTHSSLYISAKKLNHNIKLIHSSSIISSAICSSGLQIYKFGRVCTIPYWRENYKPTSFLDTIFLNQKILAHTLCLLDIDSKLGPMSIKTALNIILNSINSNKKYKKLITKNSNFIAISKLANKEQKIWAGKIKDFLAQNFDLPGPAVLIFPSKMHFLEEEFFNLLKNESKLN